MVEGSPAIVIVPGFWCSGAGVYDQLTTKLQQQGINVLVADYRSTGHSLTDGITLHDDVDAVHGCIESLVLRGHHVVVAAHSAGGRVFLTHMRTRIRANDDYRFIGSAAVEGLVQNSRMEAGQPGGVVGFAFICAGVFPRGYITGPLPFFDYQGEHLLCKNPISSLFNDLDDEDARYWNARMRPQPAANWDAEIRYTGHEQVKCHYLVCQKDQLLPTPLQEQFAAAARADVTRCDAGHMVMLSQVDALFEFLVKVMADVSNGNTGI